VSKLAAKWRFKGHAEMAFWKWVCSWARACRKPSDLGFSDEAFALPPLEEREHVVEARTKAPGQLFAIPAVGIAEEREERKRTLTERCEKVESLVADTGEPFVVWCHYNAEGDRLASILKMPARSAADSDEEKEVLTAFASGQPAA
jgi:hypothetical protein